MPNTGNLYFDIETTGLSPFTSHITVIGAAFYDGNEPIVRQFICDRPTDEKKILHDFLNFASGFQNLVHFNGRAFDIPYLRKKTAFYHLEDRLFDMHEIDLYRLALKFSKLLSMNGCKQKDLEAAFGFPRTDKLSGSDCIKAYRDYLLTGEDRPLELLLLHNKEDLLGMIFIEEQLDRFQTLFEGKIAITDIRTEEPEGLPEKEAEALVIDFSLEKPFGMLLDHSFSLVPEILPPCSFLIQNKAGTLKIPAYKGLLKHFYSDYKNYFYLPVEGRAIHKSVGQFVDAAYREKAAKATAYEPLEAIFYPQPDEIITPSFKADPDDPVSFFRAADIKTDEEIRSLVCRYFQSLLSTL